MIIQATPRVSTCALRVPTSTHSAGQCYTIIPAHTCYRCTIATTLSAPPAWHSELHSFIQTHRPYNYHDPNSRNTEMQEYLVYCYYVEFDTQDLRDFLVVIPASVYGLGSDAGVTGARAGLLPRWHLAPGMQKHLMENTISTDGVATYVQAVHIPWKTQYHLITVDAYAPDLQKHTHPYPVMVGAPLHVVGVLVEFAYPPYQAAITNQAETTVTLHYFNPWIGNYTENQQGVKRECSLPLEVEELGQLYQSN